MSEQEKEDQISVSDFFSPIVKEFKSVIENHKKENKDPHIAIFTHKTPDPDAIASMMALHYLLDHYYNIPARLFFDGKISHPQNITMVQVLNPNLEEASIYDASQFSMNILVDTTPKGKVGCAGKAVNFDMVIDHHKEVPTATKYSLLHRHTGSCSTIIHNIIKGHEIMYDKTDAQQANIATALWIGIITDTNFCISHDAIDVDWDASKVLSEVREEDKLEAILNYDRPMSWIKLKSEAIQTALHNGVQEGVVVVGLGMIKGSQRDILSDIADDLLTWQTVNTSVVFALIDGNRIEGAIRTKQKSTPLAEVAEQLAGKYPSSNSGARGTKGGYSKDLGAFAVDTEESEDLQKSLWESLNEREMQKVYRILNK